MKQNKSAHDAKLLVSMQKVGVHLVEFGTLGKILGQDLQNEIIKKAAAKCLRETSEDMLELAALLEPTPKGESNEKTN